jgi:hypothetical protein
MEQCNHGPLGHWNVSLEKGLRVATHGDWPSVETWIGAVQGDADKLEELANDLWHVKGLQLYLRGPLCRGQWQQVCVLTQEIFSAKATLQAWLAIARSKYNLN